MQLPTAAGVEHAASSDVHAASHIRWEDAAQFCQRLSQSTGQRVRLPAEAEWEYACRAGTQTRYSFGDSEYKLGRYGWYDRHAWSVGEKYAHEPMRKRPNTWGLYDVHGDVREWCQDRQAEAYAGWMRTSPAGPENGRYRVLRGGSWVSSDRFCRSANRLGAKPDWRCDCNGLRVVVAV